MRKRRWLRRERRTDIPDPEARIDQILTSYQAEIADRLETGLREIQSRTASLIHDIATEVWRSGDKDADLQERVISVLSRDAAIRGLLSHSDERYQALDIRMNRVQERLQSVTDGMDGLRRAVESGAIGAGERSSPAGGVPLDPENAELLRNRLDAVQRYLSSVLEYEAERDKVVAEWLQKMFVRAQEAIREEAGWVVEELGTGLEAETWNAADRVVERIDEQTRSIAYGLSAQEARIRLDLAEIREDQSELIREQIRALEAIESDLSAGIDEGFTQLAELTGTTTSIAVSQAAERVGKESTAAMSLGVKDVLAVMDRRLAWLEEAIQKRFAGLERSIGGEAPPAPAPTIVIPESHRVIEVGEEHESTSVGREHQER